MGKDEQHEWFTIEEAADYLRVTRKTVYNYMDAGLLPYYELKIGRGRRLRRKDLDGLLTRRTGGASEGSTETVDGSSNS